MFYRHIAVLRQLKSGFSSGAPLSGLVKVTAFEQEVDLQLELMHFAPLTQGCYREIVTDGEEYFTLDGGFAGHMPLKWEKGFCLVVCFVLGEQVVPIAMANCGGVQMDFSECTKRLKQEEVRYQDEAIAEENYYEYDANSQSEGNANTIETKENGQSVPKNEEDCTYQREQVEDVLQRYERVSEIEEVIPNSRWVKIVYAEGKHYVFGMIEGEKNYIGYGVVGDADHCPKSLEGIATYLPLAQGGYWVIYQEEQGKT